MTHPLPRRARFRPRAVITVILVAVLVTAASAALAAALPSVAGAGPIASRFVVPPPADSWESQGGPQVSQDGVAWQSGGDDLSMGYVWKIGDAAAAERDEFRWASSFDYANWDTSHVVVYCLPWADTPDEVWVSDGTTSRKVAGGVNDARNPRIWETIVVWEERVAGNWDVHAAHLDIDTLAVTDTWVVCGAAGDQKSPDVNNSVVVWQDKRSGQWDVWARDARGRHGAKRLTTSPKKQVHPRIYDGWVVWEDYRNGGYGADIYARRARRVVTVEAGEHWKVGATRTVCHARKDQLQPDVGGGFIVWTDWRNARPLTGEDDDPPDTDIRGYDIRSRERFRITGAGMQKSPDLEYRTVVYTEYEYTHMSQPWWGRIKGAHLQH